MLRRLLVLLVAGGVAWFGLRVWQAMRVISGPKAPGLWAKLAQRDEVMAEALDLRERLNRLVEEVVPSERRALRVQIHRGVEALAELVEVRLDLEAYLASASEGDGLDELDVQVRRLSAGSKSALEGLRGVYRELLSGFEQQTDGRDAVAYTRGIIDDLRAQAAAESEVRAWLAERS